ncbi:MAG: hypothetical protein HY236_11495 [Acidobacteria bacterium]|nr:hypothetical protein [Acidobacteriota bacterium]
MTREAVLRLLVASGVAVTIVTEALGALYLLRRGTLLAVWVALGAGAVLVFRERLSFRIPRFSALDAVLLAGVAAILVLVAFTAIESPPNSADAMAYHMPRVVYWEQAASVSFFPTLYFNQIMLPPLAEYMMLHTYVLSGGDRWINLVQWLGFAGSVLAVSLIAQALGAGARGQVIAAVFCATIPNGILQASGAKNECLLSLWLAAMVYFALRFSIVEMGLSLGLALMTKGTAYLFAPAMLIAIFLPVLRQERNSLLRAAPVVVLCVLTLNGPQYWRNFVFSGSVLGYDSAHGDGFFRWRNEPLGLRPTVSNLLRNLAVHLGARSPAWNQGVYDFVARVHRRLGIDLNDPGTTWRWDTFRPPVNSNHEADAPNRWQLLLLGAAAFLLPRGPRRWLWYYLGIVLAFGLFCFYLKWMPWMARLHLPLFVLASPIAGLLAENVLPVLPQAALCLLLLNNSRPYVLENWTRPLKGPRSVLRTARNNNYFSDMTPWNNQATYLKTVDLVRRSGCRDIGIDIRYFALEYPLQVLLRQAVPGARFIHTGVHNASSRYHPDPAMEPCAVVCLDCAWHDETIALYRGLGESETVDRFALFLRRAKQ